MLNLFLWPHVPDVHAASQRLRPPREVVGKVRSGQVRSIQAGPAWVLRYHHHLYLAQSSMVGYCALRYTSNRNRTGLNGNRAPLRYWHRHKRLGPFFSFFFFVFFFFSSQFSMLISILSC